MSGFNVRNHGDTRLNRFADRLDRVGDILIPLVLVIVSAIILLVLVGGFIAILVALIENIA